MEIKDIEMRIAKASKTRELNEYLTQAGKLGDAFGALRMIVDQVLAGEYDTIIDNPFDQDSARKATDDEVFDRATLEYDASIENLARKTYYSNLTRDNAVRVIRAMQAIDECAGDNNMPITVYGGARVSVRNFIAAYDERHENEQSLEEALYCN